MSPATKPADTAEAAVEALHTALTEVHRAFAARRLAPGFVDRCSPTDDRIKMAQRLQRDHGAMPELAVYAFKATLTMGDQADLCFFFPHLCDAQVRSALRTQEDDAWSSRDTNLWGKVVALPLTPRERAAADTFAQALFVALRWLQPLDAWGKLRDLGTHVDAVAGLPEPSADMPAPLLEYVAYLAESFPTENAAADTWLDADAVVDMLRRCATQRHDVDPTLLADAAAALECARAELGSRARGPR